METSKTLQCYKTVITSGFVTTLTPKKTLGDVIRGAYVKNLIKHKKSLRWLREW